MIDFVALAYEVALKAHEGQIDKAGLPYIRHPVHVAESVTTQAEKTVALLHDVIEDTDVDFAGLKEHGFPASILDAVDCLTKRDGEEYDVYLDRVNGNVLAKTVKIADMTHNADLSRIERPTEKDVRRMKKYEYGLKKLKDI